MTKRIVLVGAGHAHVEVLRRFGREPPPGASLTLITPARLAPYSGMLPGVIAGRHGIDESHIDTVPLARLAGAEIIEDAADGIDLEAGRVLRRDGPPVPFDFLSLDVGSTPNTGDVPGAAEAAIPVKPIAAFLPRFEALLGRVLARRGEARIAMVGAGAGGVELLLAIERRLRREVEAAGHDATRLGFILVSGAPTILPSFPEALRRRFETVLARRGISVLVDAPVASVEPGRLHFADRPSLAADEILWAAQAAAPAWLRETGLALDADGFVRTDACLRALGRENVFAAGDVAAFAPRPLPKAGVYAVRAGPVLARNLRRAAAGESLRPFEPQHEALYIITTGDAHAVGARNGLVAEGTWVYRVKDWIDRRFMRRYAV
ncbi:MAG TPA: FAD-dependent oxidoreductase [Beijerinckiaceae bacterium]